MAKDKKKTGGKLSSLFFWCFVLIVLWIGTVVSHKFDFSKFWGIIAIFIAIYVCTFALAWTFRSTIANYCIPKDAAGKTDKLNDVDREKLQLRVNFRIITFAYGIPIVWWMMVGSSIGTLKNVWDKFRLGNDASIMWLIFTGVVAAILLYVLLRYAWFKPIHTIARTTHSAGSSADEEDSFEDDDASVEGATPEEAAEKRMQLFRALTILMTIIMIVIHRISSANYFGYGWFGIIWGTLQLLVPTFVLSFIIYGAIKLPIFVWEKVLKGCWNSICTGILKPIGVGIADLFEVIVGWLDHVLPSSVMTVLYDYANNVRVAAIYCWECFKAHKLGTLGLGVLAYLAITAIFSVFRSFGTRLNFVIGLMTDDNLILGMDVTIWATIWILVTLVTIWLCARTILRFYLNGPRVTAKREKIIFTIAALAALTVQRCLSFTIFTQGTTDELVAYTFMMVLIPFLLALTANGLSKWNWFMDTIYDPVYTFFHSRSKSFWIKTAVIIIAIIGIIIIGVAIVGMLSA